VQILSYFPGQKVTIFLEITDGYGVRADSVIIPTVDRIIFPELTLATGYPQVMTHLDTGLYYYQFTLPTGAASVGSYLIDVSFTNYQGIVNTHGYQVTVSAPYGNFSVTTGN